MSAPDHGPDPIASVIVPSHRGAHRLPALLDSLAAQVPGTPAFEVVVVVDGLVDESPAVLAAERRLELRPVVLAENRGRVGALNAGFAAARGDVLIRCDDDLVVPPGYVRAHVDAHRTAPGEVAVAGLTVDVHPDTPYARAYGRDADRRSLATARARGSQDRWRLWAANCSITRATADRIGPYDPAYRTYGWEDIDYGYRLHAAGVPFPEAPATLAEHHGAAPTTALRAAKAFAAGSARATFLRLHPEAPLSGPAAGGGPWGAFVGLVARASTSPAAVARMGRLVDGALRVVPVPVGRKLVAALVEGAGLAGARGGTAATSTRRAGSAAQHSTPAVAPVPVPGSGRPRVAIAHDYLTQRGGAERVVLSLARAFPDAEIHTLLYAPDQTYPAFAERTVRTSALQRIGPLRRDPRRALPILAPVAARQRIDADVVIASSSGWAHAFPSTGARLVYCHSPARWLYLPQDYLGGAGRLDPRRLALAVLGPVLRRWDRRAAHGATGYLANSTVVRERIAAVYGIDAPTLFPPFSPAVAQGPLETIPALAGWAGADGDQGGHLLVVSRLQPYKHVDRVIDAVAAMPGTRLLVVGAGPLAATLAARAPESVRILGGLSDAQLRWAYARARALVAVSHEDFGLTPLEAGAHGVPTVALRAGGYLDTIRDGVTGLFVEEPTPAAVREGIERALARPWDPTAIREHVEVFSEERFVARIRRAVEDLLGDGRRPSR